MIFDKDLEDKPLEDELPYIEMKNQVSTVFTNGRLTPNPMQFTPFPSFSTCVNEWVHFETSLDRQLYRHNACLLRSAILAFLKHCLVKQVDDASVFQDGNIFCFEPESPSITQEGLSQCLIEGNSLLTPWRKKRIMGVLQKYGDLAGVFRQLKELCGRTIAQQIVCILAEVLQAKLGKMQQLQNDNMDGLLPRMQRFWGDDKDQRIVRGGWNVYNQVDYESVRRLAAEEIEQIGSKLYFSKKLKHLTLSSVGGDSISEVNLLDKFASLVAFLTEGLLLSMEGICQRQQQLQIFISDLHCTTGSDGEVHVNSSKKIKSDNV